jgi:iron complex transport system substrate-binding protein
MTAVAAGNVTTLDPDVASRWGPRVVELLGAIADALIAP